jgi:hypothetical protein
VVPQLQQQHGAGVPHQQRPFLWIFRAMHQNNYELEITNYGLDCKKEIVLPANPVLFQPERQSCGRGRKSGRTIVRLLFFIQSATKGATWK